MRHTRTCSRPNKSGIIGQKSDRISPREDLAMQKKSRSNSVRVTAPHLCRRRRSGRIRCRSRAVQYRARPGRPAEGRRAVAALRLRRPASARIASAASISRRRSSNRLVCRSSPSSTATPNSNVDTARARAEKLIGEGAQLLVGAFDSGQTDRDRPGRRTERHSATSSISRRRPPSPSRATSSCSGIFRPRR